MNRAANGSAGGTGSGPAPRVSVVIPTWNGGSHLGGCLLSVRRQLSGGAEIILVDNAGTDDSVRRAREAHPAVRIIENSRNLGFARAVNIGCAAARGEFIFILNNDTVLDDGCLRGLIRAAEARPDAAVFSPKLLFLHNPFLINSAGLEMNLAGYCWDRGFDRIDGPRWDREAELLGCSGGAMFVRRAVWEREGGFDPGFRYYMEDMDLCLRVRAAGDRIAYVPGAVVRHAFSASMRRFDPFRKEYLVQRNRLRLLFRNFNMLSFTLRHPGFWLHTLGAIPKAAFLHGEARWALVKLRALLANLVGVPIFAAHRIARGRRLDERTRALIIPRIEHPVLPSVHLIDYAIADERSEGLPERLFAGVNDFALGYGWYPRERARGYAAKCRCGAMYRWFGKRATVFLSPPRGGGIILQMHAHFPRAYLRYRGDTWPELAVRVNGREAGILRLSDEWCMLAVPVRAEGAVARIDLEVDRMASPEDGLPEPRDLGLALNEISLLPEGSVFLAEPV